MGPVIGALFAILIGLVAIRPYLGYQQQSFNSVQNANTAGQFRQILNATHAYVEDNYSMVQSEATPNGYHIPLNNLQNYLPGYDGSAPAPKNPYGQSWNTLALPPKKGVMQVLVYSTGGQAIAELQAPEIAAETGAQGGFVPYAGQFGIPAISLPVVGAYGHWSLSWSGDGYPGPGHLVGLLTFGGADNNDTPQNDYLYRVGVPSDPGLNTMQTTLHMANSADLDMGSNNIENAASIQASTAIGVSASSTTPYLAGMAIIKDSQGAPEGQMQTKNQAGTNTTTIESDSAQSSATVSADSGANSVTMVANNADASLTIGNNSGTPHLTFISTAQQAGGACAASQAGTIAPDKDKSGTPLVCMGQNGNFIWQGAGGDFTQSTQTAEIYAGQPQEFKNMTSKPEFVSTYCAPYFGDQWFGGWSSAKFYVTIAILDSSGNQISISGGREYIQAPGGNIGGQQDTLATVAPSTSAIVPAGDSFIVNVVTDATPPQTAGGCTLMETS